jgi:hypothetical protein
MVRNHDDDDMTYPYETNVTQLLGGVSCLVVLLLMCVLIACLSRRRRRRNDRQAEQNRVNARENIESRFKRRKERAESLILTLKLSSDVKGLENTIVEDEEDALTHTSSRISSPSTENRNNTIAAEALGTQCQICFEDFVRGDEISISHNHQCSHYFHKECIIDWLARNTKCPVCRRDYFTVGHDAASKSDTNEERADDVEENRIQEPQSLSSNTDLSESMSSALSSSDTDEISVIDEEANRIHELDENANDEASSSPMVDSDMNTPSFPISIPTIDETEKEEAMSNLVLQRV